MLDTDALRCRIAALQSRLQEVTKKVTAGGRSYSRFPPGSKKGGQFAPKAGGSSGGAVTGGKPAAASAPPKGAARAASRGKHLSVTIPGNKEINTEKIVASLKENGDFKALNAKQQAATVDAYMNAARSYKDFDREMTGIAKNTGGKVSFPPESGQKEGTGPLKGVDRAMAKIAADYKGDASRIADLVRATVEVPNLAGAQKAVDYITANYEVVERRSRNFLTDNVVTLDGYRDAKFVIRTKSGALAEVQVNVPSMLSAKKKAHSFYEERSRIEREYGLNEGGRSGAIPKTVRDQVKALNQKMRSIYDPVWLSLVSDVVKSLLKSAKSIIEPFLWSDSTENGRGGASSQAIQPG